MCNQSTLWNSKSGQNCVTDDKECAVHTNTVLWWASAECHVQNMELLRTLSTNVGIGYDQNMLKMQKHSDWGE